MEQRDLCTLATLKSVKLIKSLCEIFTEDSPSGYYNYSSNIKIDKESLDKESYVKATITTNISAKDNETHDEVFIIECITIARFHIEQEYNKFLKNENIALFLGRQIYPFIRSHITELLSNGGYKNIELPWEISFGLQDTKETKTTKKKTVKKKKKIKRN